MVHTTRWGIIGCGSIAHTFAEGLRHVPGAELIAVASQTKGKAEKFAMENHVAFYYDSYEKLVQDPAIDVVYIATTHNFHYENMLLCLQHGKPVLCEKSFTINASQASHVIAVARSKKLFLMEAMWTRFLPCVSELQRILSENVIGDIKMFRADLGFKAERNSESRFLNPMLAGGALLDLGIYPISFSRMVFKKNPTNIKSYGFIGETGVDEHESYVLEYGDDQTALLSTSLITYLPRTATIIGTTGYIEIPSFHHPTMLIIKREGKDESTIELPYESTGYNYEIAEVQSCLREGKTESDVMPLDETLGIMNIMDTIRSQWGFSYPNE